MTTEKLKATGAQVGEALDEYLRAHPTLPPASGVCRCLVTCQNFAEGCKGLKTLDATAQAAGVDIGHMHAVIAAKHVEETKEDKRARERREFDERVAIAVAQAAPIRGMLVHLAMGVIDGKIDNDAADRVLKIVELWRELA